jgi:phosphoribosylglycinamide formyltransferase-1
MIVTLCSGEGRTFAAITRVLGPLVTDMVTNVENAPVRNKARSLGVAEHCVPHAAFASRQAHEQGIIAQLQHCHPFKIILLLGYMRVLSEEFLKQMKNRWPDVVLANLHPAPLSQYKGARGLAYALQTRVPLWGISVHEVTARLDEGPLLAYRTLPVYPTDSFETLRERAHINEVSAVLESVDLLSRRLRT